MYTSYQILNLRQTTKLALQVGLVKPDSGQYIALYHERSATVISEVRPERKSKVCVDVYINNSLIQFNPSNTELETSCSGVPTFMIASTKLKSGAQLKAQYS